MANLKVTFKQSQYRYFYDKPRVKCKTHIISGLKQSEVDEATIYDVWGLLIMEGFHGLHLDNIKSFKDYKVYV